MRVKDDVLSKIRTLVIPTSSMDLRGLTDRPVSRITHDTLFQFCEQNVLSQSGIACQTAKAGGPFTFKYNPYRGRGE